MKERRKKVNASALAIAASLLLAATVHAAATPGQKCEAAKNDAAGKYAACLLKAQQKFVSGGEVDTARRDDTILSCGTKYAARFQSYEDRAGMGNCPSEGDVTSIQDFLDACIFSAQNALGGDTLPSDVVTCSADLGTCSGSLGTCSADLGTCGSSLSTCSGNLGTCGGDLLTCQGDLSATNTDLGTCNTNLSATSADLSGCQGGLGTCQSDLSATNTDLGTCNTNLSATSADLSGCQGGLGTCQSDLSATNTDLGACNTNLSATSADLSGCQDGLGTCQSDLSATNTDLGTCNTNLSATSADLSGCQGGLGACQSDLSATNTDLGTCNTNLSATSADLSGCQGDLGACQGDLSATNSDLTTCDGNLTTCVADLAVASSCGNGVIDGFELCDQGNLNGATCQSFRFAGGQLRCSSGCVPEASGCYSSRFVDQANGTILDNATGLIWEKKVKLGGGADAANRQDADNVHRWSGNCSLGGAYCQPNAAAEAACLAGARGSTLGCAQCPSGSGTCSVATGVTVWQWLVALNGANYGGHNDWRLPTKSEYATLIDDADSTSPLIDVAFAGASCGTACTDLTNPACSCTASSNYWSATSYLLFPANAWAVSFFDGSISGNDKRPNGFAVRAVRGGS